MMRRQEEIDNEDYVMEMNVSYSSEDEINSIRRNNNQTRSIYRCCRMLSYTLLPITFVLVMALSASVILVYSNLHGRLNALDRTIVILNQTIARLNSSSLGRSPSRPAKSCASILQQAPNSESAYYWLQLSEEKVTREYCDMDRTCGGIRGGWLRVVSTDIQNNRSGCPEGFSLFRDSGHLLGCIMNSPAGGCKSVYYFTRGFQASKVCGFANAFQLGMLNGFNIGNSTQRSTDASIDSNYVDGISFTHSQHPRKHIWTLAAGGCLCERNRPDFLTNDFYCGRFRCSENCKADPTLWMGFGMCRSSQVDWFYKDLQENTDIIEMRVCRDENREDEDIALQAMELYVQ